jgi:hypothetical protein
MCVSQQTDTLAWFTFITIRDRRKRKAGRKSKVETSKLLGAETGLGRDRSLLNQAARGNFRQPTAAEVSTLAVWMLRYARTLAQEQSNEFARLLNRGSSLE